MVRLVSLVSPFIVVTLVSAFIVVTLVFSFIVAIFAVFRCPEGSMFVRAGGGRRKADHLAAIVDAVSDAEAATGEGAKIGHHPVFKQKRMRSPARGGRLADHLAAVVDTGSEAEVATGESAEVDHHPVFE